MVVVVIAVVVVFLKLQLMVIDGLADD